MTKAIARREMTQRTDDEIVEAMAKRHERTAWANCHWPQFTDDARAAYSTARPLIERAARASADAEISDLRASLAKAEEALQILAGGRAVSDDPRADLAAAWKEHVEVMQGLARHALSDLRKARGEAQ